MTEPSEGQRGTGLTSAAREGDVEGAGGSPLATASDGGSPATSGPSSSGTAASPSAAASGESPAVPSDESASSPASSSDSSPESSPKSSPAEKQAPVGPSEALLGPFTLRELVFGGGVALVFIGTLLPFVDGVVRYVNFWNSVPLFFVGIGILLPVIALALLAGRRLGGAGLRVGSLSVDQFASVSAVLAATFFFLQTVTNFHAGPLVALIGSLGMIAATVVGPFLPVIKDDFAGRPEVPAHTAARPIAAARPRPPKPAKPAEARPGSGTGASHPAHSGVNPAAAAVLQNGAGMYGAGGAGAVGAGAAASGQSGLERRSFKDGSAHEKAQEQGTPGSSHAGQDRTPAGAHALAQDVDQRANQESTSTDHTRMHDVPDDSTRAYASVASSEGENRQEPITATRSADEESVVEAFWFAVGSPRPVFDEQTGREVFTLQPGDWEVGIEDRGSEFLVQDKRTGAIGILRDLRNIERAPRD